jgi:hypothetical protein
METPNCPVCGEIMIYNKEGLERNPKAPTFKCSDRQCKRQLDKNTGNYVVSEYITGLWVDDPNQPKNAPQANSRAYRPTQATMVQRKEFQNTMDYKATQIEKAQAAKEDSMRLFSSGRDSVLIVTSLYPELTLDGGDLSKEDLIKDKIKEWRKYFYNNVYNETPFV